MPPQQQTRDAAAAGDMAKILPAWQKHVQGLKGLLSDRTEAKIYATLGYSTMDTDIVIERLISQVFNNEQSRFDFAVRKQQTVPAGSVLFIYEIYRGLIDKMYRVYTRSRRVKRAWLGPPWRCLQPLWHAISSSTSCSKDNEVYEDDLVDYDEEVENDVDGAAANPFIDVVKKGYVRIRNSGFGDFLLKPELLRAI